MLYDIYGNTQFERELLLDADILNLVMNDTFAKNLYASLCNNFWVIDGDQFCSTWIYAGGVVAHLRYVAGGLGECYLDFYCSGCEGEVFDDVQEALGRLGWLVKTDE